MDVAYFGGGRVGALCHEELIRIPGYRIVEPEDADLWISVHWPHIFKPPFPSHGILNLHNGYLPWGRGAHPCSWAIAKRHPHGVTMHWVDAGVDTGPIFMQQRIKIHVGETADQLYKRTVAHEISLFRTAMHAYLNGARTAIPQEEGGTFHRKRDFERLVRACTTSDCLVVRR